MNNPIHPAPSPRPTGAGPAPVAWASRPSSGRDARTTLRLAVLASLVLASAAVASLPEPETLFYGRIVNRTLGPEHLLTQGQLVWVVTRPDGRQVTLTGRLEALRDGQFSYRLGVPHQALASGVTVATNAVPLAAQPAACSLAQVTVDGFPARILAPGNAAFEVAQPGRAATRRLDFEVANPLADTDGDGLPDWWADLFDADNALADPDADGWNNLEEYRRGSRPDRDDRRPSVATREVLVYADGTTGVRLASLDADSPSAALLYTLTAAPTGGALLLRNAGPPGGPPDRPLAANDTFTQADVDRGRLVFAHQTAPAGFAPTRFELTLRDEDPAHPAARATVDVNVYRPAGAVAAAQLRRTPAGLPLGVSGFDTLPAEEQQCVMNYLAGREAGLILWDATREGRPQALAAPSSGLTRPEYDAQYLPAHGPDRGQLLLGGAGDDLLAGSMEADVLIAGAGHDRLIGHGGGDLFIIGRGAARATLQDFHPAEGDTLDLSRVLAGSSPWLLDYLQASPAGADTLLRLDPDGLGGGFGEVTVTLQGVPLDADALYEWADAGRLLTGDKRLPARVTLAATVPAASENGPAAGRFTLTRQGPADAALTVNLLVTGSAANGVDYAWIAPQALLAAGQRSLDLAVTPYPDALTELAETVEIILQPGAGYVVGAADRAQVVIEDLAPLITLEPLVPLATQNPLQGAAFLVTRSGVLDRGVLLRLTLSGTATAGTDYNALPAFINLPAGQTAYVLDVVPKPGAVLNNGAETVGVAIRPDAAYKLGHPSAATVWIVEEELNLGLWQQRHFPGVTEDPVAFASADYGATGVRNLLRYAFQLDPVDPASTPLRMPRFEARDGRLCVLFRRPAAIADLRYLVEISSDLRTWSAAPEDVEPFFPAEYAGDSQMQCFRSARPSAGSPNQFMRVRVLYTP